MSITEDDFKERTQFFSTPDRDVLYINDALENPLYKQRSINLIRSLTQVLFEELRHTLEENIKGFYNYNHYWREIQKRRLIKYLEFATDETLVKTANSLLCAFKYPGTYEGLIALGRGIFGENSLVVIESKKPAVLKIIISNANEKFYYALADSIEDENYAIAVSSKDVSDDVLNKTNFKHLALVITDLQDAVSQNMYGFFKRFLTPGRVLLEVEVDYTEVEKDKEKQHDFTGGMQCMID